MVEIALMTPLIVHKPSIELYLLDLGSQKRKQSKEDIMDIRVWIVMSE